MSPTGFANTGGGNTWIPVQIGGFPEPASTPAYDYPMPRLLGMVSDVVANYNYDKQGNVLAKGHSREAELWAQLVRVLRSGCLAHKAELDGHLRRALVVVPAAMGGQRIPGVSDCQREPRRTASSSSNWSRIMKQGI